MVHCPICGNRFDDRRDTTRRWLICSNCNQQGAVDGSNEHWRIAAAMKTLVNHPWTDEDLKMLGSWWAFVELAKNTLPFMRGDQLVNFLKQVVSLTEEQ